MRYRTKEIEEALDACDRSEVAIRRLAATHPPLRDYHLSKLPALEHRRRRLRALRLAALHNLHEPQRHWNMY